MGKDVWVKPHEKGWAAQTTGTSRAAEVFKTQAEAIERGRAMAELRRSELVIQGRDGQIRAKDSHGHDPRRTKG